MTNPNQQSAAHEDPEGSIFLFGPDENPERYYARIRSQLLHRRGLGANLTPDQAAELYAKVNETEREYLQSMISKIGHIAVAS